jgi:large subunit ribosomal protein L31
MKEKIHPDYHEITIVMTDGTSYKTRSTYGKAGDSLRLDIDSKSHPAWTGGQHRLLDTGGQLARFNKRFQGFGGAAPAPAAAAAIPAADAAAAPPAEAPTAAAAKPTKAARKK